MRLMHEVVINRSRTQVWQMLTDPGRLSQWQPTLSRMEQIGGEAGQPGSVTRLVFAEDGSETEWLEIIAARREPDELSGWHEGRQLTGHIVSRLQPIDEDRTRWVVECKLAYRTRLRRLFSMLTTAELRRKMVEGMNRFQRLAENQ